MHSPGLLAAIREPNSKGNERGDGEREGIWKLGGVRKERWREGRWKEER